MYKVLHDCVDREPCAAHLRLPTNCTNVARGQAAMSLLCASILQTQLVLYLASNHRSTARVKRKTSGRLSQAVGLRLRIDHDDRRQFITCDGCRQSSPVPLLPPTVFVWRSLAGCKQQLDRDTWLEAAPPYQCVFASVAYRRFAAPLPQQDKSTPPWAHQEQKSRALTEYRCKCWRRKFPECDQLTRQSIHPYSRWPAFHPQSGSVPPPDWQVAIVHRVRAMQTLLWGGAGAPGATQQHTVSTGN